jgi:hypothetical protein
LVEDTGTLPWIDYEGIDLAHSGTFQDYFSDGVKDVPNLRQALESGLREEELIPALLDDFRVWQRCPPDRYIFMFGTKLTA